VIVLNRRMQSDSRLEPLVRTAVAAALAGGRQALQRFRDPTLATETKADSTPVTEGDRASEAAIFKVLRERHPGHSVVGEESGKLPGDAALCWYVDPIDGTRSYCRGLAAWATLVGLAIDGIPAVGVIFAPALDQLAVAWRGGGAWLNGQPIQVSRRPALKDALISIGSLDLLPAMPWGERAYGLMGKVFACRGYSDAICHIEVARGHLEAMIDPRGASWDFAAVAVLIREAGGRFTSLSGSDAFDAGDALVSNGPVHQILLDELAVPTHV
jgi:histidinol-phosphatase